MLSMSRLAELAATTRPRCTIRRIIRSIMPRLTVGRSIFHVIRDAGSILLLHPYESFSTSVERFLREAETTKVRRDQMTLYRTSSDSKINRHLCDAAHDIALTSAP